MDKSFGPEFQKKPTHAQLSAQHDELDQWLLPQRAFVRVRAKEFGLSPRRIARIFESICTELVTSTLNTKPTELKDLLKSLSRAVPLMVLCGEGDSNRISKRAISSPEWALFTAALSDFICRHCTELISAVERHSNQERSSKFFATKIPPAIQTVGLAIESIFSTGEEGQRTAIDSNLPRTLIRLAHSRNLSQKHFSEYATFLYEAAPMWLRSVNSASSRTTFPATECLLSLMNLRAPIKFINLIGENLSNTSVDTNTELSIALRCLARKRIDAPFQLSLPAFSLTSPQLHALGLLNRKKGEDQYSSTFHDPARPPFKFQTEPAHLHWEHLLARLEKLSILPPERRDLYLIREVNLFLLQVATQKFSREEEFHFNNMIFGAANKAQSDLTQQFYNNIYRVDHHPAGFGTSQEQRMYERTYKDVSNALQARTALNVLKGYTQTTTDGDWLLERVAACSGGSATVLKTKDINIYPGSGCILQGLRSSAFLDLSTPASRRAYYSVYPWIEQNLERLPEVNFYLFRGFAACIRKEAIESDDAPRSQAWQSIDINGVAYAPIVFSDHFHNWNPEMRLLYVPEITLGSLLRQFHEKGCDPCKIDISPQAIADLANAHKVPILNVATAAVLFSGHGSAWPFASEPYWDWEAEFCLRYTTPFRDPFHLHHSFQPGRYTSEVTTELRAFYGDLIDAQQQVSKCMNVYNGLFQCFMTAEAVWGKEGSYADGTVATLDQGQIPKKGDGVKGDMMGDENEETSNVPPNKKKPGGDQGGAKGVRRDYGQHPRTRVLQAFLETRARTLESLRRRGQEPKPSDFPRLEIQFAGKYDIVPKSPVISGFDLSIMRPGDEKIPLFSERELHRADLKVGEYQEALWYEHFSKPGAFFKLHYGPRIVW